MSQDSRLKSRYSSLSASSRDKQDKKVIVGDSSTFLKKNSGLIEEKITY